MRIPRLLFAVAAAAVAVSVAVPPASNAFTLVGFQLPADRRDVRIFNNFPISANTNFTPDPNFPGAVGPPLAVWKAAAEWASMPHAGQGLGDPTQVFPDGIGSGGANFDFVWQGLSNTSGLPADRILSWSPVSLGAGIVAITTGPGAGGVPNQNGWQILFSPDFVWFDGPGTMPPFDPRFDIQGVAAIEFGLALGLGTTTIAGATMFNTLNSGPDSVSRRSIEADDKAGIQTNYGIAAATKPRIFGFQPAGPAALQPLVIFGQGFAATGNEVWFNSGGVQATGAVTTGAAVVKVLNLASTGGGTMITVLPPCNVVDGDFHVKVGPTTTGDTLSNGFPIVFASGGNGSPCAQCIGTLVPSSVPVLSVPQTEVFVNAPAGAQSFTCLPGTPPTCPTAAQYSTVTSVTVGGVVLGSGEFTIDNDNQVRFSLPLLSSVGPKSVVITTAGGPSCPSTLTVTAVATPQLETGAPLQLPGQVFVGRMASPLGFNNILLFSASNLPSVLPGIVSLGIGDSFADVSFIPTPPPNGAGISTVSFVIPPAPGGGTVYLQGVAVSTTNPFGSLPLQTTAVRSVTIP